MGRAVNPIRLPSIPSRLGRTPVKTVRVFADAFIPWKWVKLPEPPLAHLGPIMIPPSLAELALDFFVRGDGRSPVRRSREVNERFRLAVLVEVDLLSSTEARGSYRFWARNQESLSEIRLVTGRVLKQFRGRGQFTPRTAVTRLGPASVRVDLSMSGNVPLDVAGPQPAIDFSYSVDLEYRANASQIEWRVRAVHDGFPGHELFIEHEDTVVRPRSAYLPVWFADVHQHTAEPSEAQAVAGSMALAGQFMRQAWWRSGSFPA